VLSIVPTARNTNDHFRKYSGRIIWKSCDLERFTALIQFSGFKLARPPRLLAITLAALPSIAEIPFDGSIITIDGKHLQASYEGGDGNDLPLTVVP
jgi:hypothetical protein